MNAWIQHDKKKRKNQLKIYHKQIDLFDSAPSHFSFITFLFLLLSLNILINIHFHSHVMLC